MIIKSLKLTNFRNHATYHLVCQDKTSLILGPNGSGKTSVLEAIYILLQGKSFRASDPDIIKRSSPFYRIDLELATGEKSTVTYDGKHKTFHLAEHKYHRLPQKHRYPIVLFEPSDLNLITQSPTSRRAYFDRVFSQFDPTYATNLSRYHKALKQRNQLLKSDTLTPDQLFSWNLLLARHGLALYRARSQFTDAINTSLTTIYRSIATNHDTITISYQTEITAALEQAYLAILEQNFQRDYTLGHTTFGPHRDDYLFLFNGTPALGSASRGESRSIILALKFIEADLIYQKNHLRPLILLDNVFSELDNSRRTALIQNFKDHQIILTSVEEVNLAQ